MTEIRKSKQKKVVKGFGNWILEFEFLDTKPKAEPFTLPWYSALGFQCKIKGIVYVFCADR
jgi:hypothetical protein